VTRAGDDEGAATVIALALVGLLLVAAVTGMLIGDLMAARQRAADTADLAALAGVAAVLPSERDACEAAAWVAGADGARLRACQLLGSDVRVTVSCAPRGPWVRWWRWLFGSVPEPAITARAGRRR
jgi:secretion/DNA translocation related TadE-like protein